VAEWLQWGQKRAMFPSCLEVVMNDAGPSKNHLTSRYQLMSGHQLIKLLRLTRLAVMSAISFVSSDQRFNHARDQCHASIKLFAIEILVRVLFLQLWLAC
jgi:hypothetical protein